MWRRGNFFVEEGVEFALWDDLNVLFDVGRSGDEISESALIFPSTVDAVQQKPKRVVVALGRRQRPDPGDQVEHEHQKELIVTVIACEKCTGEESAAGASVGRGGRQTHLAAPAAG